MQHSPPLSQRPAPIRGSARIPVLQPFAARLPIPPPYPLGLAITQLQHRGGIPQLQILLRHPPHHFYSLQLPPAHGSPLQQTSSGWRFSLRGHFYRVRQGTLSKSFNRNCQSVSRRTRSAAIPPGWEHRGRPLVKTPDYTHDPHREGLGGEKRANKLRKLVLTPGYKVSVRL